MIKLINVEKVYQTGAQQYHALKGLSLTIAKGEMVAIMGPSGSGKTTTMNILGLLDRPSSGQYLLAGEDTSSFSTNALAELRNRSIGFVFQSFFLLPKMTALQNVGLPLRYAQVERQQITQRSLEMLERVGMLSHAHHKPGELSGGQQQRVAIARALVTQPKVILADEPTGALDSATSKRIMQLLLELAEHSTVVVITHDAKIAEQCQRTIHLCDGRIKEV